MFFLAFTPKIGEDEANLTKMFFKRPLEPLIFLGGWVHIGIYIKSGVCVWSDFFWYFLPFLADMFFEICWIE